MSVRSVTAVGTTVAGATTISEGPNPLALYPRRPGAKFEDIEARAGAPVSVSDVHANFFVTGPGAMARDVIALMEEVERRVADRFGVHLEREVVVWSRSDGKGRGE